MDSKAIIALLVAVVHLHLGFTSSSKILFQENDRLSNVTLENKDEKNLGWTLPTYKIPKWLEYYDNISDFKMESSNEFTCAKVAENFTLPSETNGIWVACQDHQLPLECFSIPTSPCHPVLKYDTKNQHSAPLRTIKLSFYLHGLAILRLSVEPFKNCFYYSHRKEPFSPCEFLEINNTMVKDGWVSSHFIFDPYEDIQFQSFSLEMIARFANDVVLLDKVEASQYLLCTDDDECITTTRITTTGPTTSKASTTPNATTENDFVSDPDGGVTTTQKSVSCLLVPNAFLAFAMELVCVWFFILM